MADEPTPNPAETLQKLLAQKNNDAMALASQLFDENFQLREKNREIKAKLPGDGTLTLSAEEAKEYNKIKTFLTDSKLDLKSIKEMAEKVPTLEKQNKELAGMETMRDLAEVGLEGSKLNLNVLKDQLQKFPDAQVTFKTEKDKDGNEAKVAYIRTAPDATEVSFTDFAKEKFADYLPALKVSAEAPPVKPGHGPDPSPNGGTATLFDRIRTQAKEAQVQPKVDIDARFGKAA